MSIGPGMIALIVICVLQQLAMALWWYLCAVAFRQQHDLLGRYQEFWDKWVAHQIRNSSSDRSERDGKQHVLH